MTTADGTRVGSKVPNVRTCWENGRLSSVKDKRRGRAGRGKERQEWGDQPKRSSLACAPGNRLKLPQVVGLPRSGPGACGLAATSSSCDFKSFEPLLRLGSDPQLACRRSTSFSTPCWLVRLVRRCLPSQTSSAASLQLSLALTHWAGQPVTADLGWLLRQPGVLICVMSAIQARLAHLRRRVERQGTSRCAAKWFPASVFLSPAWQCAAVARPGRL